MCDFTEQAQSGDSKPDLIVRLPGDRMIIVDAKVPDLDFLNAIDSADATKRAESLAAHAKKLKKPSACWQTAIIPGIRQRPGLRRPVPARGIPVQRGAGRGQRFDDLGRRAKGSFWPRRHRSSPFLRSVSLSWQQHAQTENARAIADAAQELYTRVAKFTEHFERIRDGLNKATSAYNDAVGSYERMVRPSGEKFLKLGGGTNGKELADVQPLDATLRLPGE